MTDEIRANAIRQLIERHRVANTANPDVARASIVRKGIYTEAGRLTPEYGGDEAKPARRTR